LRHKDRELAKAAEQAIEKIRQDSE
jgi:hypothetical protein